MNFDNYLKGLNIDPAEKAFVRSMLNDLKLHHPYAYEHSFGVSIIGGEIAGIRGYDDDLLRYCGLLHDIGKKEIDPKILCKQNKTPEEKARNNLHVIYSYHIVRFHGSRMARLAAEIIIRNHIYNGESFPENIPVNPEFEAEMPFILEGSRYHALADFYHSLLTRETDRVVFDKTDPESVKQVVKAFNPDQIELIDELFAKGIFGSVKDLNNIYTLEAK